MSWILNSIQIFAFKKMQLKCRLQNVGHCRHQCVYSLWPNDIIWISLDSGNGLLPGGTKPLPEPMLTYH